jgi:hypothetical protein
MGPSDADADGDAASRAAALEATLAEVQQWGVDRFSIEGVSHRAKLSIEFLRETWADERQLIVEALRSYSEAMIVIPDTGSLCEDLTGLALSLGTYLNEPVGRRIARMMVIDSKSLVVDADIRVQFWALRQERIDAIFERATQRGEIKNPVKPIVALQLLTSPLHSLALYTERSVPPSYCRTIAELVTRALTSD